MLALSYVYAATGLAFLPLGDLGGRFVLIGFVLMGVAAVALKFAGGLSDGDENARLVITGLMATDVLALVLLEPEGAGLFFPMGMALAVIGLLWGPAESRTHFTTDRR